MENKSNTNKNCKYHINNFFGYSPKEYGDIKLYQIGTLFCEYNTVIKKHFHVDWYEITAIKSGEGIIVTNDIAVPVKKGDIYLSFPNDFHEIKTSKDNLLKYDFFSFNTTNPNYLQSFNALSKERYEPSKRIFKDEELERLIMDAISEVNSNEKYGETTLKSLFDLIIIHTLRNFDNTPRQKKQTNLSEADTLCFKIMQYIDTHTSSILSLTEISDALKYSYAYLSNMFKTKTGDTIQNYYNNRRLETAKLLLDENKLKITEIADLLNYSSIYVFSNTFSAKYGISPKQYQIKNKKLTI